VLYTHSSVKLKEISDAQKSGDIVNFHAHPALVKNCYKNDEMLQHMRDMTVEVDVDFLKIVFGLNGKSGK